jgi:hypothetical protein
VRLACRDDVYTSDESESRQETESPPVLNNSRQSGSPAMRVMTDPGTAKLTGQDDYAETIGDIDSGVIFL